MKAVLVVRNVVLIAMKTESFSKADKTSALDWDTIVLKRFIASLNCLKSVWLERFVMYAISWVAALVGIPEATNWSISIVSLELAEPAVEDARSLEVEHANSNEELQIAAWIVANCSAETYIDPSPSSRNLHKVGDAQPSLKFGVPIDEFEEPRLLLPEFIPAFIGLIIWECALYVVEIVANATADRKIFVLKFMVVECYLEVSWKNLES